MGSPRASRKCNASWGMSARMWIHSERRRRKRSLGEKHCLVCMHEGQGDDTMHCGNVQQAGECRACLKSGLIHPSTLHVRQ